MADLDDGPEQAPLPPQQVRETAAGLLAGDSYEMVLTHGPWGEYTRHRRHEECCRAVLDLWQSGKIATKQLWLFAYEDGGRAYLPRVRADADCRNTLDDGIWLAKRHTVTELYGFGPDSWEARTAPREEGFWCFASVQAAATRTASWEKQL